MIVQLIKNISIFQDYKGILKIDKGLSFEDKYIITTNNDRKYLVRIFTLEHYEGKSCEFSILKTIKNYTKNSIEAIEIGKFENKGYMVTTYLEGFDAEVMLPTLTDIQQYQIGYKAGEELYNLHKLQAPEQIESWYERKRIKHQKYINAYKLCDMKINRDEEIMNFIDNQIYLMKNRPNLFQHDDYHPGNLIVKDDVFVGIIDFGRYDWGDPIHEFLKIGIFTRNISIPFSIGQIKGYIQGKEPTDDFWSLYSLYLAMCIFSTIVWTLKVIPDEIENMVNKINIILEDHNYFKNMKPSWYVEKYNGE